MNLPDDLITALQVHIQNARQYGYNGGFVLITGMKELHNQVIEIGGVQFRWRYHKNIPITAAQKGQTLSDVYVLTKRDYKRQFGSGNNSSKKAVW